MDVWAIIYTAHENNPTERIRLSCIIARKGLGGEWISGLSSDIGPMLDRYWNDIDSKDPPLRAMMREKCTENNKYTNNKHKNNNETNNP